MAAAVNESLATTNQRDAVAHLIANRVPDRVIARVQSERADADKRRARN